MENKQENYSEHVSYTHKNFSYNAFDIYLFLGLMHEIKSYMDLPRTDKKSQKLLYSEPGFISVSDNIQFTLSYIEKNV